MTMYTTHNINPSNLLRFMIEHQGESVIFREMYADKICLDTVKELSKAEYNMTVLNKLLTDKTAGIVEEEKAAIEYAIECIKTLDDMGIIKENKDND